MPRKLPFLVVGIVAGYASFVLANWATRPLGLLATFSAAFAVPAAVVLALTIHGTGRARLPGYGSAS